MLLSHSQLLDKIVRGGVIRSPLPDGNYVNVPEDHVNATSIDITLGRYVLREEPPLASASRVSVAGRELLNMKLVDLELAPYALAPGDFILAQSHEQFFLPNHISAEYKLKSSMARIGLEHLTAGWCDAGWNGSVLTLELRNMTRYHTIILAPGDRIGQMVFLQHEPVPDDASYATRGRYNGDLQVSPIKE